MTDQPPEGHRKDSPVAYVSRLMVNFGVPIMLFMLYGLIADVKGVKDQISAYSTVSAVLAQRIDTIEAVQREMQIAISEMSGGSIEFRNIAVRLERIERQLDEIRQDPTGTRQ